MEEGEGRTDSPILPLRCLGSSRISWNFPQNKWPNPKTYELIKLLCKISAQETAWYSWEQVPHTGGELRQWDDQLRRRGRRCDGHILPRRHCLVQEGSKKHSPTFEIWNRGKDKENVAGILLQVRRSSPARSLGDPAHALDVEHHLLILGFLKCWGSQVFLIFKCHWLKSLISLVKVESELHTVLTSVSFAIWIMCDQH